MLYDIAISTGGTVISDEIGISLDNTEPAGTLSLLINSCFRIMQKINYY